MSNFYTRSGDDGYTGFLGEGRPPKYHPRIEAVGALDEATAAMGLARASSQAALSRNVLLSAQRDLYGLMAEVAATPENAAAFRTITSARVTWLETQTDEISGQVAMPKDFIVPGDSAAGAALALARTIIRRAERRVAYLIHHSELENLELLHYLNRLSSLCFVLELLENQTSGKTTPTLAKQTD